MRDEQLPLISDGIDGVLVVVVLEEVVVPLISDGIDGGHRHGFKSNQWLSRGKESLPASYAWLPNHRGPPIMMMLVIIMIMVIMMMLIIMMIMVIMMLRSLFFR